MATSTEWARFCCAAAAKNSKEAADFIGPLITTLGAQTHTSTLSSSASLFPQAKESLPAKDTHQPEPKPTQ